MTSVKKKLDPEFRKILHELTLEYITKSPEDFVEFAIQFIKNKQKLKVAKIKPVEQEVAQETEESIPDEVQEEEVYDMEEIRRNRRNVFQEGMDETQDHFVQLVFKTDEQKAILRKEMQKILIFQSLVDEDLNYLADVMSHRLVSKGEVIIKQDDEGDFFYVVESGKFVAYRIKDGETEILKNYENEGFFGELALLYNVPRSCSVKAESEGNLWCLDRITFRQIVMKAAMERRNQYMEFLKRVPLLSGLSNSEQLDIADCLQPQVYSPGSCIIKEGDTADGMYFLLSGTAKVVIQKAGQKNVQIEVKRLVAGDYFGELALVTHKPRAASVYAVDEVNVAFLDTNSFERLLGPCVDLMRSNISQYDQQLKQAQEPQSHNGNNDED